MKRALLMVAAVCALVSSASAQRGQQNPRDMGGGQCNANPYNCSDTPNPLTPPDTVWLEEMTWMDVRDAMKAGKLTVIISTGGMEPNGPWLALGKHNYVLKANCDAIARKLGNAVCAPVVAFVPEGGHEPPSGHMRSPGTISLKEDTFQALLSDIALSYKVQGFKNIVFIGDSGGNGRGMTAVADKLTKEWGDSAKAVHVREHYDYDTVGALLRELKVITPDMKGDGLHDDPGITLNMMVTDPESVRWSARVKANKATINGVSIADKAQAIERGKKIVDMRATNTVAAIKKALGQQ